MTDSATKQWRLAVIDDEADIRQLVRDVAEQLDFTVDELFDTHICTSAHCATCTAYFNCGQFDVIVLDLMMPGVDGIELMRRMAGNTNATLLLICGLGTRLVSNARQIADTHGLRVGGTLNKPFRVAELRDLLRTLQAAPQAVSGARAPAPRELPRITEAELTQAIARDELVVHFQPQVEIASSAWVGVEALVRWPHPVHGLLYPDVFIPLAEQPAHAEAFTKTVLRKAVQQAQALSAATSFEGTVSVNLPPTAMSNFAFPDWLVGWIDDSGFPRSRLMMEITETSIPQDDKAALEISMRMRMRGIHLSIDDFGTGYSSLERLRNAASDELKIDLTFVREMLLNPASRSIVESAIRLGQELEMTVVAEGIEDFDTLDLLRQLGCNVAQGYLIAKPMAVEPLCDWARTVLPRLQVRQQKTMT